MPDDMPDKVVFGFGCLVVGVILFASLVILGLVVGGFSGGVASIAMQKVFSILGISIVICWLVGFGCLVWDILSDW